MNDAAETTPSPGRQFGKYKKRGAYHWRFISPIPLRRHCPTTARYKAVLAALPDWRNLDVVDIGCGDGALTYLIAKRGAKVTGVDTCPEALELARTEFAKRGTGCRFLSSMDNLPDSSFDVAVCAEVIEHVADPGAFLENIRRILRPSGRLVLSPPVRLTEKPLDSEHIREYFPSEIEALAGKYFHDVVLKPAIPMAGLMLYYWRPWFFLRLPVIRFLMDMSDILIGINPVERINALDRYHTLLLVVARRPDG
jgi:2-polyprenyl-3-methyl-5-hydroxy-6-metoxy-1,4-benzoquinol methylase